MATLYDPRFQYQTYLLRRQFFKLFGAAFHIYGPDGQLAFYSKQKAFRLKEDIRLYADESATQEVLTILARSWLDFAAAYDVIDAQTGEKVGGLKRRGFTEAQIRNLKNAYRVLYRSDLKLADAVAELKKRAETQPELRIFVDFIGESTRSLVR